MPAGGRGDSRQDETRPPWGTEEDGPIGTGLGASQTHPTWMVRVEVG